MRSAGIRRRRFLQPSPSQPSIALCGTSLHSANRAPCRPRKLLQKLRVLRRQDCQPFTTSLFAAPPVHFAAINSSHRTRNHKAFSGSSKRSISNTIWSSTNETKVTARHLNFSKSTSLESLLSSSRQMVEPSSNAAPSPHTSSRPTIRLASTRQAIGSRMKS